MTIVLSDSLSSSSRARAADVVVDVLDHA